MKNSMSVYDKIKVLMSLRQHSIVVLSKLPVYDTVAGYRKLYCILSLYLYVCFLSMPKRSGPIGLIYSIRTFIFQKLRLYSIVSDPGPDWIRIQASKNDPQKKKSEEISSFKR